MRRSAPNRYRDTRTYPKHQPTHRGAVEAYATVRNRGSQDTAEVGQAVQRDLTRTTFELLQYV